MTFITKAVFPLAGIGTRFLPTTKAMLKELLPGMAWMDDPYVAAKGADAIVILTEWKGFRALDLGQMIGVMTTPAMADLRQLDQIDGH